MSQELPDSVTSVECESECGSSDDYPASVSNLLGGDPATPQKDSLPATRDAGRSLGPTTFDKSQGLQEVPSQPAAERLQAEAPSPVAQAESEPSDAADRPRRSTRLKKKPAYLEDYIA